MLEDEIDRVLAEAIVSSAPHCTRDLRAVVRERLGLGEDPRALEAHAERAAETEAETNGRTRIRG